MKKSRILAVVGPTAGGKTALSVELAKRAGGEVISCDSMQIYRGVRADGLRQDLAFRNACEKAPCGGGFV